MADNLSYFWFLIAMIFSSFIEARPVSYPGGITLMQMNDTNKNSFHLHYSPTAEVSFGYKFEYWREKEFNINALQMNNLLKRWNKKNSQANIYFKSAVGNAYSDKGRFDEEIDFSGFVGLSTDWEDRNYFVQYENRYTKAGKFHNFFKQSMRLGWAPYTGDYGDLHTWLMFRLEHMTNSTQAFNLTPHIRFFKDVHLLEIGANLKGKINLNYVFRY